MNELIILLNKLMSGSLPTKEIDTDHYIITISADPSKVKMEDKITHYVFIMKDFTEREIILLACIAVLEGV